MKESFRNLLKYCLRPPDLVGYFFIATLWVFLYGSLIRPAHNLLGDSDLCWLIKTGLWILEHQQVPDHNVFGIDAVQSAIPLVCYQWLYEVILGGSFQWLGFHGVVLVGSLIGGLIVVSIGLWLKERGFKPVPDILLPLLMTLVLLCYFAQARPYLASFLLVVTLLRLLKHPKKILWIPLLFLLWANIHLGFVAGIGILAVDCLLEAGQNRSWKPFKILGLSLLATGLNPNGFELYTYLWNLGQSPFMNGTIEELQSINFHQDASLLLLIMLGILAAIRAFNDPRIQPLERVWFFIGLGMSLYSIRHLYLFFIFMTPFVAAATDLCWHQWSGNPLRNFQFTFNRMSFQPANCLLGVSLVALTMAYYQVFPAYFKTAEVPAPLFQYLKAQGIQEKILMDGSMGSYFLYFSPKVRGVLDTRFDMYGDSVVRKVYQAYLLQEGWQAYLQEAKIHYILYTPDRWKEALILENLHGWKPLYKDDSVTLLQDKAK